MTRWLTDTPASKRFNVYTRANAADVLAEPMSPLCSTLSWPKGVMVGWREGYVANFSETMEELTFEGLNPTAGLFNGYFYNNATIVRVFGIRAGLGVEGVDSAFFGSRPDTPAHASRPDDINEELSAKIPGQIGWVLSATEYPELDAHKAATIALRETRPDLTTLSDADLVARARAMSPALATGFHQHVITSSNSAVGPGILATLVPDLAVRVVAGAGDVDSAAPSDAMWELSRLPADSEEFRAGFEAFLRTFGSRGPNEWDPWSEVWETKPSLALTLIDAMRPAPDSASPIARHAAAVADREAATAEALARLAGNDEAIGTFRAAQSAAMHFNAWRERSKANCVRAINEQRVALFELGRRHVAAGHLTERRQVCMLTDDELDAFVADPARLGAVAQAREVEWKHLWTLEPPFFIEGDKPIPEIEDLPPRRSSASARVVAGDVLTGDPGCTGIARGRARVLLHPDDAADLEPGDILVAPNTDPSWTPLFVPAAGVVVDVGALNSHAVIVSRELGIPCVVSVFEATHRIPDGAEIEVDGSAGRVTIISVP
jgi:pyruvate,water dikinase